MSNFWGAHHFGCWRTPIGIWRRMWRVIVRQFGGIDHRCYLKQIDSRTNLMNLTIAFPCDPR